MSETLWISIPTNEENELKDIINSISSKNLPNLSIKQLIEKLENNQAADWIAVLGQYNAISAVNNIDTLEMLDRARSVRNKFAERGFLDLQVRQFEPRELLSLVILCYSNPDLIGHNLCTALNDNNNENVKKEMLQFSAYRKSEDRVLPSQSNLRLLGTAIYFNDTNISLPKSVIAGVKRDTIRDGRMVRKLDQRNGLEEWIDGSARARNEGVQEITPRKKRDESEIDSHSIWQSLKAESAIVGEEHTQSQLVMPASATQIDYSDNGSMVNPPEALKLNGTNNATSANYASGFMIGSLALFHIARNTPVAAVVRNIVKDFKTASEHVGSFFSKNTECAAEQEQKTVLLSPTAKS